MKTFVDAYHNKQVNGVHCANTTDVYSEYFSFKIERAKANNKRKRKKLSSGKEQPM